ncbi:MAG TPA: hypothetical protein VL122_13035 [Nitrospirota bacterium]|nr:hypothetical protein [Nitrospirota bacterium]
MPEFVKMANTCGTCKYGHETKPGGQHPSPNTVWCAQRGIQMAKHRSIQCFTPPASRPARHCLDCKKAKLTKPSGEAPQIGHVWCEKRHAEFGKQRNMECFE